MVLKEDRAPIKKARIGLDIEIKSLETVRIDIDIDTGIR